jgi:hypothetical protein
MYDIVYIGNDDDNWKKLKERFVTAKRTDSFEKAKRKVFTKMFWIVWQDTIPLESFLFDYEPDDWSKEYIHVFLNEIHYDGICLFPKSTTVSEEDFQKRIFENKKEVDIMASIPKPFDIFNIDSYDDYLNALDKSTTDLFWMSSLNITVDKEVTDNFYIPHHEEIDRNQNHSFLHNVDGNKRLGIYLCSKHKIATQKEIEDRHIINRKEWDIVASHPVVYDAFDIDTYEEYLDALENSKTEMFWITFNDVDASQFKKTLYFNYDNEYDKNINHTFIHNDNGNHLRNGVWLCSKNVPLSKKEVEYRFIVNSKEHNEIASVRKYYDRFTINTYEEYNSALEQSTQEMFWAISDRYTITDDDIFNTYFPKKHLYDEEFSYERSVTHIFKNGIYNDGLMLCSKNSEITKREWEYGFIANKQEHDTVVSQPNPYDIVFISYQEPTADENYERLLKSFPRAKRVHGVKGIHQAHIAAAKQCTTDMIWIVDGDAHIVDDFNFDYQVPLWKRDNVFVWRSQNPINDLVYGYGGVKLFPRQLTIDMDISKPDMTTSISEKFNPVQQISNITAFNTGEFETWKSAFRECAKLSSKIIDRQKNDETEQRLETWCTVGEDRPYGSYALAGARAGREFGLSNRDDLKLINNFDWLKEQFNEQYS